jgi:predicted metal-dependent phosphotriesterase family hydrolase
MDYYLQVLKRPGVYLSFDRTRPGGNNIQNIYAKNIAGLIKIGYTERILISSDSVLTWTGRPFNWPSPDFVRYCDYIPKGFRILLREQGVADTQFDMMTVENPKRLSQTAI